MSVIIVVWCSEREEDAGRIARRFASLVHAEHPVALARTGAAQTEAHPRSCPDHGDRSHANGDGHRHVQKARSPPSPRHSQRVSCFLFATFRHDPGVTIKDVLWSWDVLCRESGSLHPTLTLFYIFTIIISFVLMFRRLLGIITKKDVLRHMKQMDSEDPDAATVN